jgi:organic hydroperoxide reductase OsmC/OhrA
LQNNDRGKPFVATVTLHPEIRWAGQREPSDEQIAQMHSRAHEECVIANSINTDIRIE